VKSDLVVGKRATRQLVRDKMGKNRQKNIQASLIATALIIGFSYDKVWN
jgi:uncharacterized membrane protein